jgi:hypothetical protein
MNKTIIFIGIVSAPAVVFAQGSGTLQSVIATFGNIANLLVSILSVFAFVAFFYGLATYILNSADEEKKEAGKNIMIWGTIALFVLVTIWGIIGMLQRTVGSTQGPGKVDIIVPRL